MRAAKYLSDATETRFLESTSARFAYRRFGSSSGIPLVLCMRFRGTIDHWDPAFLEVLAPERELIIFDNVGTGASSGKTPTSFQGLAEGAIEFIVGLGLEQVDLLGWSMGGYVAQRVALDRPDLVNRLVVAGSGPGGVPGQPAPPDKVWQVAPKPVNDDEDFLYLFFPETPEGREAGLRSLRRLDSRLRQPAHLPVSAAAVKSQIEAIRTNPGLWERVPDLKLPVLVANGMHDVMIHAFASYAMAQRLPSAKLILYSDAGHGFLFQHPDDFGVEVNRFLG